MKIEYRHPAEEDAEDIARISNLSNREMKHHTDTTADEVRTWFFGEEDYDPEGYLLAIAEGQPVAYCGSIISKQRVSNGYSDAYIGLSIVPEWRGKGIEDRLMQSAFEFLKSKSIEKARYYAPETTGWRNDFAVKLGMKDVRHGYTMIYDKGVAPEEAPLPEPYSYTHKIFTEMSDDEIHRFVTLFNESFVDHWNFSSIKPDRFIKAREDDIKRRDSVYKCTIAETGGEPAGLCFYGISDNYNKEHQKKAGLLNILGVRQPYRRQGIGRAILSHSMSWLWDQGMNVLLLGMDAENSKALGLYTSLGFRVDKENITYELKLNL